MAKDKKTSMKYTPFKMKGSPMKRNFPNDMGAARPGDSPAEAWDWSSAGGGAAKGAAAGASIGGPWGAVIGGALGGITSGISGGKEKELLEAQQMEEQKKNEIVAAELKKERVANSGYNVATAERAENKTKNEVVNQRTNEGLV